MFNSQDKAMLKGLNKLLDEATFPLKKREVAAFALVVKWLQDLDKRIDADLNKAKENNDGEET